MDQGFRLPEAGEQVGDYRIVERLGEGSQGTVFKAERAGRFYAVKFLRGRLLDRQARREASILVHLEHPNVVRFLGYDYWPDPARGHPFLVMEFAGGRTLTRYAREENASARGFARLLLEVGLTLGAVHRQGVLHRDLKPDNILLRDEDACPVLVDFGVGALVGAPPLTEARAPPGTPEFLAPEAWRFARESADPDERYPYSPDDELWALGVTFYWLLTDVLPFGERWDEDAEGLGGRILHRVPVAPRVLNPRVPPVLSGLCLRMLEKDPAARHGSVEAFCAALEAALDGADAGWDMPLFDRRLERRHRGHKPDPSPEVSSPRAWRVARIGLAVGVMGAFLLTRLLSVPPEEVTPEAPSGSATTRQAGSRHEIAPSPGPPDPRTGDGEAPQLGSTSTPVTITMLPKDDPRSKPPAKKVLGRVTKALGTGLICQTLVGCPTPQQQLRPTPEPAACPDGALETMKKLGIELGRDELATFQPRGKGIGYLTVQEGETALRLLLPWGGLPSNTILSGRLIPSEKRVFGRLTGAQPPGGETVPICMEVIDIEDGRRGILREPESTSTDSRIFSSVHVIAVSRFK